jgi:signal transduction histidine kinase
MMHERKLIDVDLPKWAMSVAFEILKVGYSLRTASQVLPDMLRLIIGASPLGLEPRAALYVREPGSGVSILAGCYNIEWSMLDPTMAGHNHIRYGGLDHRTQLYPVSVPITDTQEELKGFLRLYLPRARQFSDTEETALLWLSRHLELVVRMKQSQDEERSGILINPTRAQGPTRQGDVSNLLQLAVEHFPGGLCVLEADLSVSMTNRRFYELLSLPEERFAPGVNFADIIGFIARRGEYGPGDVDDLVAARIAHAKLFLEHSFERETVGGLVLEARTAPAPGGGCVLTYVDVTARKKAERDLLQHRDHLEETVRHRTEEIARQAEELERLLVQERHINELQRQFVAMTSHEFRTPLAIIDGAAQRLVRRKIAVTPEFVAEKAEQIRSSVSRMLELMESILSAGRLDHGKITVSHADCSLVDVLRTCSAHQTAIRKSHHFRLDTERLPPMIVADRTALEQVFSNLFSNAVKYAPDAPDVYVTGWQDGGTVRVTVRDEGLGIDADDLPRMFQRYFRARTSTGIAGTGIGLNFVRQIVELHGGTIEVESTRGKGTTFTVAIPIAPARSTDVTQAVASI